MAKILKCPNCESVGIIMGLTTRHDYQCSDCSFHGPRISFKAHYPLSPNPDEILEAAAKTFTAKNKEYGENWRRVGPTLMALFGEEAVTLASPKDHERFHILMLIVVKLTRYTANWEHGGHKDSIHDAAVYAAMLEAIDNETDH